MADKDKKVEDKDPAVALEEATAADAGGGKPPAGGGKSGGGGGRLRGAVQGAKDWGAKPASRWWPVGAFAAAILLAGIGLAVLNKSVDKKTDALSAQTRQLGDTLGTVSEAVRGIATTVAGHSATLSEHGNALSTLQGEVTALTGRVAGVEGKVSSLETAVGHLPTKDELRGLLDEAVNAGRAGDEAPKTGVPPDRDANADTAHNAVNALRDEAARLDAENAALRAAAFSRDPHAAGPGGSRSAGPVQP